MAPLTRTGFQPVKRLNQTQDYSAKVQLDSGV